jgi:hypothetical protein
MDKLTMTALLPDKNPSFILKALQNLANFHRADAVIFHAQSPSKRRKLPKPPAEKIAKIPPATL